MNNRRGFTLLEVLISVVVLAIGLVGVVAIFPAVIDLQRRTQDAVIGTAAASSAEAHVIGTFVESGSRDWIDWEDLIGTRNLSRQDMFPAIDVLKLDRSISERSRRSLSGNTSKLYDFLWETSWDWSRGPGISTDRTLSELESTGDLILGGGSVWDNDYFDPQAALPDYTITLAQRLLPDAASAANPRYVYDMVVRRVDSGIGYVPRGNRNRGVKKIDFDRLGEVPLQIAVFVRRIDRNIRVPSGVTLRESLSGQASLGDTRYPLAVKGNDRAGLVQNGKPGGDAVYSHPIEVTIRNITLRQSDSDTGLWDLFDPTTVRVGSPNLTIDSVVQRLSQVGQLFIDNKGVVRRVRALRTIQIDGTDREVLVIDPPFSSNSSEDFKQIVFTPQVPVGIRVIDVR